MKSTSRKTWQTSLLFLEPLQIQNLKRKSGGAWHIVSPPPHRAGETRPPCPPPNCAHAIHVFLPDGGKLFAKVDSFLHTALCFSQGISFDKKLIHLPLCCKTSMQTYFGQMDCTGSSPETVFRFGGF